MRRKKSVFRALSLGHQKSAGHLHHHGLCLLPRMTLILVLIGSRHTAKVVVMGSNVNVLQV